MQLRESDRRYLQEGFLHSLAIGMLAIGWAWGVVLIAMRTYRFNMLHWVGPISLIVSAWAASRTLERRPAWATAFVLSGASAAIFVSAWITGRLAFLYAQAAVVIIAGILTSPLVILSLTLVSAAFILSLQDISVTMNGGTPALLLSMVGACALAWALWHHVATALELSWQSRQRAMEEAAKARQRRGELRRALKALDEGYERLRRLNQELVEARREAEEARKLKAEFAANVSHELRTPINLIVGFSEMMFTSPESYGGQQLPPEYLADVHTIYRSARHLQALIDDILDLSRIDARRMTLTREVSDIGEIVSEACEVIRELVERKGLFFSIDIQPNLPRAYIDRTRIRQVILNLVSNAARFTEKGEIRVSCSRYAAGETAKRNHEAAAPVLAILDRPYLHIAVADTGVGIPAEELDKVFEEFRQVDGSLRREHGGTGLGLAISKRFVTLHGGWMWAESRVGIGSTFHFVLPTAEAEGAASFRGEREHPDMRGVQRTLVALDADVRVHRVLGRHLGGMRVIGVDTPQDAAQALIASAADLILVTDDTPPERVLQEWCKLRCKGGDQGKEGRLSVLACRIPGQRHAALSLGLVDYLIKPVSKAQLLEALARLEKPPSRILVVDDDPDIVRLIERMLARPAHGVRVDRAYSGAEAQARLCQSPPDVVLLDLALPDMRGEDLLAWMRQGDMASIPVMALTANTDWEEMETDLGRATFLRDRGFSLAEALTLVEFVVNQFPARSPIEGYALQPITRQDTG